MTKKREALSPPIFFTIPNPNLTSIKTAWQKNLGRNFAIMGTIFQFPGANAAQEERRINRLDRPFRQGPSPAICCVHLAARASPRTSRQRIRVGESLFGTWSARSVSALAPKAQDSSSRRQTQSSSRVPPGRLDFRAFSAPRVLCRRPVTCPVFVVADRRPGKDNEEE